MIADTITKSQFIVQTLDTDIQNIYKAMSLIAEQNLYVSGKQLKTTKQKGALIGRKSGSLLQCLQSPDYIIQSTNTGYIISAAIVQQLRFMDMVRFGNRRIYNRQVWGILYNNTLKQLHNYYGTETYNFVGDALKAALNSPLSSGNNSSNNTDYGKARGRES